MSNQKAPVMMKKVSVTRNANFLPPEELLKRSKLTIPKKPAVAQAAIVQVSDRLESSAVLTAMLSANERTKKEIRNPVTAFLLTLVKVSQYSFPRLSASFCSVDRGV